MFSLFYLKQTKHKLSNVHTLSLYGCDQITMATIMDLQSKGVTIEK